jgi:hypothetical protein
VLRHPEESGGVVQVGAALHQPGGRRVTQNVGNDVEAKPCISPRPFPRCPNFPCQRRPVHVNHVTNFGRRVEPSPTSSYEPTTEA